MARRFKKAEEEAEKRRIGGYERHFFICIGPDCCSEEVGDRAWTRVKKRLAEDDKENRVYRTKVGCLRICKEGPVGVVYPEGTWYAGLSGDNLERVIDEHLLGGNEVPSLVVARNPLPAPGL